jgi:hypothetical protein
VAADIRAAKDAPGMLRMINERGDLKIEEFNQAAAKLSPEERELAWWGEKKPLRTANFDDLWD